MPMSAATKWKLYVNPGHGGYTDNDRQTAMPKVNGVALPVGSNGYNKSNCFWESSGNTYRALGVKYFWEKRVNSKNSSASVKLSRSTNSQDGDLTLSSIAQASNTYGGYFMSLHTNAGTSSANYMIIMCGATSKTNYAAKNSTSLKMAKEAAYWQGGQSTSGLCNHGYGSGKNLHMTSKTYSTDRGMTDRQFYSGSGLGVLNTNNAPGYLAESWFHDYRPEAFRLCSEGYNYFLAWQLMRAYLDEPGLEGVNLYPIIFGDIRNVNKSCGYTNYTTRGRDKYLAINGATVTLRNVATGGTKTYTTDEFNNGFYTFYDCVEGATYEITVSKKGYKSVTKEVTVGADGKGTQHKVIFDLEEGVDAPVSSIAVNPTTLEFAEQTVGGTDSKTITVTGTSLSSAISITSSNTAQFSISASSVAATGGSFTITYKPTVAGNHSTTITLTSGSVKKTMIVSGSAKNPPLTFTQGWNYSEVNNKRAAWMANWSNYRNFAYGDGKLYVVDAVNSVIKVINAQTAEHIKDLAMTGVDGGTLKVIDVNYLDGKIIACGLSSKVDGVLTPLKVYVWDNDNAIARVILETTNIGNAERLGDTFNLLGNLTNGTLYFAEGKADTDTKVVSYKIVDGVVETTPAVLTVTEDGEKGVQFGLSPRVIPEANGKFWCIGQNYYPTLFDAEGLLMASVNEEALGSVVAGNAFKAFTFKGTQYAVATTYASGTGEESLKYGKAVLLDCTDGWANAEGIGNYPSEGLGTTRNTSMSGNVEVNVNGDEGVEMWVLVHNQGIAYYKYGVTENEINSPKLYLENASDWNAGTLTLGNVAVTKTIEVSGANLTGDIVLSLSGDDADMFKLSKSTISKNEASATITISYDPTEIGLHSASLVVSTEGAADKYIELSGKCNPNLQAFKQGWYYGVNSAEDLPSWAVVDYSQTAPTRFIAENNGKLYVLNSKPWGGLEINIIDAYTGKDTGKDVNVTGISGGITSISSIRFVDGVLVGANAVDGTTHKFIVYAWKDGVDAAPTKILEDATRGGIVTMGSNVSYSGNLTNGYIWATDGGANNVIRYQISNGEVNALPTVLPLKKDGTQMSLGGSRGAAEVIPNEDGTFWVDGQGAYPTLFNADGTYKQVIKEGVLGSNTRGTGMNFFYYNDIKYLAAITYEGTGQTNGYFTFSNVHNGIDITEGYIWSSKLSPLGSVANGQHMSSIVTSVTEDGTRLNIWICCGEQGVAYYYVEGKKLIGDVNNDGALDVSDVMALANYVLSKNTTNFDTSVGDVNRDGAIDVSDVMKLANNILNK